MQRCIAAVEMRPAHFAPASTSGAASASAVGRALSPALPPPLTSHAQSSGSVAAIPRPDLPPFPATFPSSLRLALLVLLLIIISNTSRLSQLSHEQIFNRVQSIYGCWICVMKCFRSTNSLMGERRCR